MLTITYSKEGKPNSDGKSRELAKEIVKKGQDYETSTESLIDAFRVMLYQMELSPEDIQYKYKGEIIPVDADGRFSHYPEGFCDQRDEFLDKLLGFK